MTDQNLVETFQKHLEILLCNVSTIIFRLFGQKYVGLNNDLWIIRFYQCMFAGLC